VAYQTKEVYITPPNQNVDNETIKNGLVKLQDFYVQMSDDGVALKKRPGLSEVLDLGTNQKGDGLYWFDSIAAFIAVSNGRTYKIAQDYTKTDLTGATILPNNQVSFAEKSYGGTNYLFICNGSQVIYTNGTAATQAISSITFNASCIVNFNNYLIVNKVNSNEWYYNLEGLSSGQTPFVWNLAQMLKAESNPDSIDWLTVVNNRLYIWGKRSLETWYLDASAAVPFTMLQASQIKEGVISPHSIQIVEKTSQIFLDENRRVRLLSGGNLRTLSTNYGKELQKITTATDATSAYMLFEGKSFYIITFKSANKTFVYDLELNAWSEYGYFNTGSSEYSRFIGEIYAYSPTWNKHFFMSNSNGKVYEFSQNYKTDDSNVINSFIETGNRDHGTNNWKRSRNLRALITAGTDYYSDPNQEAVIELEHADDGSVLFSNRKTISLKNSTQTRDSNVVLLRRGGRYKSRKYRLYAPDSVSLVIYGIYEEVEIGNI